MDDKVVDNEMPSPNNNKSCSPKSDRTSQELKREKLNLHLETRPMKSELIDHNIIKSFNADPKLQGVMQSLLRTKREAELGRFLKTRRSVQDLMNHNIIVPSDSPTTAANRKHLKESQLNSFLESRPTISDIARLNVLEDTMTWTRIVQGGTLPLPRNCLALASVDDHLYLTGGYGSGSRTGELLVYDSETKCWSRPIVAGVLPAERFSHTCSVVGSQLVLFGGCSIDGIWLNDVFVLDTSFKQPFVPAKLPKRKNSDIRSVPQTMLLWYNPEILGEGPCARAAHSATVIGNSIYVFGGNDGQLLFNDLFILDVEAMEWSQPKMKGDLPCPRAGHTATAVGTSIVLFGGGAHDGPRNDMYILDTTTMTWYALDANGTAPSPRFGHQCELVLQNKILLFGGGTVQKVYNDLHMLDIESYTWSRPSDTGILPVPRSGHATACINNQIYIFGGADNQGNIFNDLHILDTTFLYVSQMSAELSSSPRRGSEGGFSAQGTGMGAAGVTEILDQITTANDRLNLAIADTYRTIESKRAENRLKEQQIAALLKGIEDRREQQFDELSNDVNNLREVITSELEALRKIVIEKSGQMNEDSEEQKEDVASKEDSSKE